MCSFLSVCFRFLNRIASALVPLLIVSCPALDRRPWVPYPCHPLSCLSPCKTSNRVGLGAAINRVMPCPRSSALEPPSSSVLAMRMPPCCMPRIASIASPRLASPLASSRLPLLPSCVLCFPAPASIFPPAACPAIRTYLSPPPCRPPARPAGTHRGTYLPAAGCSVVLCARCREDGRAGGRFLHK